MFESTSDKILRILIDNDAEEVELKLAAVKASSRQFGHFPTNNRGVRSRGGQSKHFA